MQQVFKIAERIDRVQMERRQIASLTCCRLFPYISQAEVGDYAGINEYPGASKNYISSAMNKERLYDKFSEDITKVTESYREYIDSFIKFEIV